MKDLDKLTEQADSKVLARLSANTSSMVLVGYLFLLQALTQLRRH